MNEFYDRDIVNSDFILNRKKSWRWLVWMLLCLMFLTGSATFAQASSYTFAQSSGTYTAITGGTLVVTSTNNSPSLDSYVSSNITIPSFNFAGVAYTKMYVTGNGQLALGTSAPSGSNYTVLASTTGGNVFLAPFSADLNGRGTGVSEIRFETVGNELVVQWQNFQRYSVTESINFQVRMNTSTGVVKFVYGGSSPYGSATTYQPQVGIKSSVGNYSAATVLSDGSWNTPTMITTGITTSSKCYFSSTVGPGSGLTYTWTPLVLAPCVTPSAAPTALVFGTITATAINSSFTAASPAPSKYLVVRSTSATPPTPVDGTVYTVGATTLGAGTNVRSISNATTISDTSLTAETLYYYYIFSYNDLCSGAPFYMASSLNGSQRTACASATALASNTITTSSANITWTGSGNYIVEYGVAGFTPGTGATAGTGGTIASSSATSPFVLTGLNGSTGYQVYVRQVCSISGYSVNSSALSVATSCASFSTFPYAESFEGISSGVPTCWAVAGTTTNSAYNFSSFATGQTGKGLRFNSYLNTDLLTGELITPTFDLTSLTNAELKFYFKNPTGGNFQVLISSDGGSTYTTLQNALTAQVAWLQKTYDITAYKSASVKIKFIGTSNYGDGDAYIYLDEIIVQAPPACLAPTISATTSLMATTATINWNAPSIAPSNGYNYEIRTAGAVGSGATGLVVAGISAAGVVTANITGLSASTTYSVYVQSNCGGSGTSTWTPGGTFTTTQIAATLPFIQDFSGANSFSFVNGTQTNQWVTGSAAGNPGNSIYISNDAGVTNAYTNNSISTIQAYRDITIPTGTSLASLSFDWQANGESCCDYLRIWLVPTSFLPSAGTQISAGTGRIQVGGNFNQQTTWQTYNNGTLDLSSFANSTMRLVFEWRNDSSGGTQTPAAVDNISLLIPTCVAPTALVSSAITATTATLSWTASSSSPSNGYDIYYSTTNTAPVAGTTPNVDNHSASPLNAIGLTAASTYYWWIRSDCGGETSAWTSGGSFTTLCVAFTIPYSENFDTTTTGSTTVPSAPTCWSYLETAAGAGSGYTNSSSTPNTAPNHFYLNNSSDNSGSYMLVSPNTSELSNGLNRVKFYAKAGGAGYVLALGTLSDPLDVNSFTAIQLITLTTTYTEYTLDLPAGSDSYLVFKHGLGGTYRTIYIDNVIVQNIPSCLAPTALVSSAVATTTATLTWTASASSPSNGYDIFYSTDNTAPLAGTTPNINDNSASTVNVTTGLAPSSTYYWWVRSDCGAETSTWASGGTFATTQVVATLPYSQDFSGANSFSLVNGTQANQWVNGSAAGNPGNSIYISNDAGATNAYTLGSSSVTQAYRDIAIPAGTSLASLSFDWNANGESGYDYLRVWLVPTSFIPTAGAQITTGSGRIQVGTNFGLKTTWQNYSNATLDLSSFANSTMRLVFEWKNDSSGGAQTPAAIDNISLSIPSCASPTNLISSAITTTTATLSWTAPASAPSGGYNYELRTSGIAGSGATGLFVVSTTAAGITSVNITGLTSATSYSVYVQSNCGGETSTWGSGGSFTTLCASVSVPTTLETFESSTSGVPVCWSTSLVSGTVNWGISSGGGDIDDAYAGVNFMEKVYTDSDAVLVSLPMDYSSIAVPTQINTYLHRHQSANVNDQYKVFVNTSPSLTGATEILSLYSKITIAPTVAATGWYNYTIDIPASFNGQAAVYIIFEGITTAGFNSYALGIDNFRVELTPCPTGIWTGTTSTAFNTASNWADNMVPEACTTVTVNVANPMVISSDVTVASLTLGATAVATVNGILNVGNITVAEGGTVTVGTNGIVLQSNAAPNTGLVSVERASSLLYRQDYTLWSSPVSGMNLRSFSPATLYNRFSYYDTTLGTVGDYVAPITAANINTLSFNNGEGYLIRMPNDWPVYDANNVQPGTSFTGTFKGVLNNGTITKSLSLATTQLNLVGNPYPSPISITAFFAANPNIEQQLYFWRKRNDVAGSGYVTYTPLMGMSNSMDMANTIKSGQGFFVKSITATTLTFNNGMRTSTQGTPFLKSANETNELHRFWLRLSNSTGVAGQTLIGYATGATQGVDNGYDALYFNDAPLALTSLINNAEYIIQGRALPFVTSDIVPLGFKTSAAGSFTISLANFDGLFAQSQDIFLRDNATNTLHNLKLADYTFTTQVGVFNTRFEVHYNTTLGTDNPIATANQILIGVKNQQIKINAGSIVMEKIELIDVAGRVIYTVEGVNATTATIENIVASNQMLIVRISTKESGVVNQKIIF